MKVVLADDDSTLRDVISSFLKQEKRTVKTCSNGPEGLELMKAELPDMVITDSRMPGWSFFKKSNLIVLSPR